MIVITTNKSLQISFKTSATFVRILSDARFVNRKGLRTSQVLKKQGPQGGQATLAQPHGFAAASATGMASAAAVEAGAGTLNGRTVAEAPPFLSMA